MPVQLSLTNVVTNRGHFHLSIPGLQLGTGKTVLLGSNGSGKTTLLRWMMDAARDRAEGLTWSDDDRPGRPLRGSDVVALPQSASLPSRLRVSELLTYCAYIRDSRTTSMTEHAERSNVVHLLDRRPGSLSGGERQRVNLAVATIGRPKVLLLDEPTVALDPPARESFNRALEDVVPAETIIVVSTHLPDDLNSASAVIMLEDGHVEFEGDPANFLSISPTARFDDAFSIRQRAARG